MAEDKNKKSFDRILKKALVVFLMGILLSSVDSVPSQFSSSIYVLLLIISMTVLFAIGVETIAKKSDYSEIDLEKRMAGDSTTDAPPPEKKKKSKRN
jgi:hypothetical protein